MSDLWQGDRHHQVVPPFQSQVTLVEQVQGQLKVEDGAVAPRWQVAAELAEEQLIRDRACWRGDVSGNLGAAVDPVMDVVAQVSSEVTVVWQDVQRDAREGKEGGDFLQKKKTDKLWVLTGKDRCRSQAQTRQYWKNSRQLVFGALAKDKLKPPIPQMLLLLTHAEPWDTVQ